ncbi:MAG: heavy metal translocating P-type ATPase [Cyclobacteriaceae bacterium]
MIEQKKEQQAIKCYHCGEECQDELIKFAEKEFCCLGCKTVFEILQENDLCEYYDLENFPGSNQKRGLDTEKFDFLDNEEISQKLLDFASPDLNKVTFHIPKIHCSSCIWLLENLYKLHSGVAYARVNFSKKTVAIDYNPADIRLSQLAQLLANLGYEPYISLEDSAKKRQKSENKQLYMKIGVAGFCFGNIMLLSFPDYLGIEFLLDQQLKPFFSGLNILLAIPVVFYAGIDYFVSAYKGLKQRFVNIDVPIALGIFVLLARSLYDILAHSHAGYLDSLAGLVFFLLIGKWFQSKTYQSLAFDRDYKSYFPLAVTKMVSGKKEIVPVYQLKEGDILNIRNQEIIPCDSRMLSDHGMVDYSFVTGESRPVPIEKGNYIYAGGRHQGSGISVLVEKKVDQSYLTRLWNHESFQKEKELLSKLLLNRISKYFTAIILAIAFGAFLYWWPVNETTAWNALTAVLIVACPCALALSVPFTYGNVTRVFGRNNFYLKNAEIIEFLLNINHVVFDKTGTITTSSGGEVFWTGVELNKENLAVIKSMAGNSTHPLSLQIYAYLHQNKIKDIALDNFHEIPAQGIEASQGQNNYQLGSASMIGLSAHVSQNLLNQSQVYVSQNGEVLGHYSILNQYRQGLASFVDQIKDQWRLTILSGDGNQEEERLKDIFPANTTMLFKQKPEDKLQYISSLQVEGQHVLMVGDGLNDAGALRQSNVGIAVVDDTSSFSPASDAILEAKSLTRLHDFLSMAKSARTIIWISFIISFLYNITGISFAVAGLLTPILAAILMPLSSISVIAFATFAVNFMAKLKKLS